MDKSEYQVGESVEFGGRKYIITGLDANGAFILKTPYEIRREQNKRYNIGDEIVLDGMPHFISEIVDGQFVLKTFKEIYNESCCKVCKYFCKDNGWMLKERVRRNSKMPITFGCSLGQINETHKVTELKKQCSMKNFIYRPREEVRKGIEKIVNACPIKMNSLSKIMRPIDPYGTLGIEVIDAEKECVTIRRSKSFSDFE